jgi:hypothetical protein
MSNTSSGWWCPGSGKKARKVRNSSVPPSRTKCPECGRDVAVNPSGLIRQHNPPDA